MTDTTERTHWAGCWKTPKHHECAISEINRLVGLIREAQGTMSLCERGALRGMEVRWANEYRKTETVLLHELDRQMKLAEGKTPAGG